MNAYTHIFYFIVFLIGASLTSCSSDDEPAVKLFSLDATIYDGEATVKLGVNTCSITYDGWGGTCTIDLNGDFDSYNLSEGIPTWITVKTQIPNKLVIIIGETSGERTGKVGFTVFKGGQSESGSVVINQTALTQKDFENRERKAIDKYLSSVSVKESLPSDIANIEYGENAPFYKLDKDGNVYMQVLSLGSGPKATNGETIYIRFARFNLISYLKEGVLPSPEGNFNSLDASPAYFKFGNTSQWGEGLQLPLKLGIPTDSQLNLIISSCEGITAEMSQYIPFLYNINYYSAVY